MIFWIRMQPFKGERSNEINYKPCFHVNFRNKHSVHYELPFLVQPSIEVNKNVYYEENIKDLIKDVESFIGMIIFKAQSIRHKEALVHDKEEVKHVPNPFEDIIWLPKLKIADEAFRFKSALNLLKIEFTQLVCIILHLSLSDAFSRRLHKQSWVALFKLH